jgi:DNA polymerase III epsilon subunit-like protein
MIDVESSGPVPGLYSMVSLGCTHVREAADGTLSPGEDLYLELRPLYEGVEEEAMQVNGLDIDALRRDGLEARDAMERLRAWVRERTPPTHRPVFVAHNAVFDWAMVNHYFQATGIKNPFGYSALDQKALAMGVLGIGWGETNKEVLPGLLGVAAEDTSQKHRADYDARYQAELFCALMSRHRARQAPPRGNDGDGGG